MSSVFTECPSCQTIFRVTGAILRAGHGQVECGQCHVVFDAIERLIDDMPPGPGPSPAASLEPVESGAPSLPAGDAGTSAAAPSAERWANDLPTGEFLLRGGQLVPVGDPVPDSAATQILVEEPGAPEEITLEGNRIEITGAYRVDTFNSQESLADEEEELLAPQPDPAEARHHELHQDDDGDILPPQPDMDVVHDDLAAELAPPDPASPHAALWTAATSVLLLVLLLQVIHHFRQELARHPRVGPAVQRVYAALGLPLGPNWDLTGYEISQWGVAVDPEATGTLKLRASILNRAGFAQPLPLIRLTLEDRWGDEVGEREFEPGEYLAPGTPLDRALVSGQRVNAEIDIVDPGEDAVGFQVDVCLRDAGGLECAGDRARGG